MSIALQIIIGIAIGIAGGYVIDWAVDRVVRRLRVVRARMRWKRMMCCWENLAERPPYDWKVNNDGTVQFTDGESETKREERLTIHDVRTGRWAEWCNDRLDQMADTVATRQQDCTIPAAELKPAEVITATVYQCGKEVCKVTYPKDAKVKITVPVRKEEPKQKYGHTFSVYDPKDKEWKPAGTVSDVWFGPIAERFDYSRVQDPEFQPTKVRPTRPRRTKRKATKRSPKNR